MAEVGTLAEGGAMAEGERERADMWQRSGTQQGETRDGEKTGLIPLKAGYLTAQGSQGRDGEPAPRSQPAGATWRAKRPPGTDGRSAGTNGNVLRPAGTRPSI